MAVTYEQIREFMRGYFLAYSEEGQLPDRQQIMDKYYAPDVAFDAGFSGRELWYRICRSHPTWQDRIEPKKLCIDAESLTVSAMVTSTFVERGTGNILQQIGMNAFYTLSADDRGDLKIARVDVFLESDLEKIQTMMKCLRG